MSLSPKSLVIYLPNLAGGGVERQTLLMIPFFTRAGYTATFLLHRADGELIDSVPPNVRVVSLECGRTMSAFLPIVRFLREEQPDILLSCLGHNNIIAIWGALLARVKTRVIVSQHNTFL